MVIVRGDGGCGHRELTGVCSPGGNMKTHEQFQGESYAIVVSGASPQTAADCEDRLHAVRSALAGVSGALHLLTDRREELPDPSRRRLESLLVGEVERLRRMVAPLPGGDQARRVEALDLDGLVGTVVLNRRMCGQDVAWTPSGCQVRARADDVVEALNILLVNAWRHAQGAPARVEVTRRGESVRLQVSDDGPGVLPELRDRIFERAVRRPGSRGQGIGLAMARDLVENLGGSLTLNPPGPQGACFCLTLPAVEAEGAA